MAYCGPKGIPYDVWLGIADGWTEHSRQCALAWQARESRRHHRCGQVDDEWRNPDGTEMRAVPYEVVNRRCLACEVLDGFRDEMPEAKAKDQSLLQVFVPTASRPNDDGDATVPG